jgi:hypothetical protein
MPLLGESSSRWALDGRLNISLWMSSLQRHLGQLFECLAADGDFYDYMRTTEKVLPSGYDDGYGTSLDQLAPANSNCQVGIAI